jgi:hypothetical protein
MKIIGWILLLGFSQFAFSNETNEVCTFNNTDSGEKIEIKYTNNNGLEKMYYTLQIADELKVLEVDKVSIEDSGVYLWNQDEIKLLSDLLLDESLLNDIDFSKPVGLKAYSGLNDAGELKDMPIMMFNFYNDKSESIKKIGFILMMGFKCDN